MGMTGAAVWRKVAVGCVAGAIGLILLVLIGTSIRDLVAALDPQRFWQINRGTIVHIAWIDKVSRSLTGRGVLRLKSRPETLTISRSYLHRFKQM
jgi:DNA-binding LytR/AlgR family response regulator